MDAEYDHDASLAMYESRASRGTAEQRARRDKAAQVPPLSCKSDSSYERNWACPCKASAVSDMAVQCVSRKTTVQVLHGACTHPKNSETQSKLPLV